MPIFFCGDITIDNFEFYGEFAPHFPAALASATNANIERRGSHAPDKLIVRQLGGTYLLARFTGVAWSLWYGTNKQKKRARLEPWEEFNGTYLKNRQEDLFKQPRKFDRNWQLSYRLQKFKDDRFRVAPTAYEGFTLPLDLRKPDFVGLKELKLLTGSKETLFVLNVVNDRGEYEKLGKNLADAIANEKDCWVVMKIIDPPKADTSPSALMATLLGEQNDRVIGVIPADELRRSGAPISRALSWERTLDDVINHIKRDGLLPGNTPPNLVITFDYDAALYLKTTAVNGASDKRKVEAGDLIFSIEGAEGEFASTIEGTMPGAESVFVSALSALLHKEVDRVAASGKTDGSPLANIRQLLACALIAKRRYLQSGFAKTDSGLPFEFEATMIGNTARRMPRLHLSQGIFSHLEAPSPQNASVAPDPFILDERKIEQRTFRNPLELTVSQTMQQHKLAHHHSARTIVGQILQHIQESCRRQASL